MTDSVTGEWTKEDEESWDEEHIDTVGLNGNAGLDHEEDCEVALRILTDLLYHLQDVEKHKDVTEQRRGVLWLLVKLEEGMEDNG